MRRCPPGLVAGASGLVDLAYGRSGPARRPMQARALGLPVVDGIEFLALQAGESFRWWTGLEAPSRGDARGGQKRLKRTTISDRNGLKGLSRKE